MRRSRRPAHARGGRGTRAQATVEMAVVAPVLIILALIVYNVMIFLSATARFDRVVPDIVIAHGVSPAADDDGETVLDASETIEEQIEAAMGDYGVEVEVSLTEGSGDDGTTFELVGALYTYTCTMSFTPWPTSLTVAGVELGSPVTLSHTRAVTIDPWRPGVVM